MTTSSTTAGVGFGLIFAGLGAGMMVLMAMNQDEVRVPLWVAEIAGSTFVFAGLSIVARAKSWLRLQRIFAVLAVYGLAIPGLWILLGPDTGSCSGTFGFISKTAANAECRIVFGLGGIITLGVAIFMTIIVWRKPVK